tara:strand:+ start:344 stop:844 length:501 start_codon:yes stop_codon:yes gene_type:complete
MNYLDLLTDDLIEKILELVENDYKKDLNKLIKNVNKLKNKLRLLYIDKYYLDEDHEYIYISYGYITYCIDEYLFKNFKVKGDIVLIYSWNDKYCFYTGSTYISEKLSNPTYFEIIVEANKSKLRTLDKHHTFLNGLTEIFPDKVYDYVGIVPEKNIRYFEFIIGIK